MICITIQHKDVYEQLKSIGTYRSTGEFTAESLVKAYKFMQREFNWKSTPIFLAPVGYNVEMGGATFEYDYIAIELDIPPELVKVQEYYNWSDFIYFLDNKDEFRDSFGDSFKTVEDWGKTILDDVLDPTLNIPYQVCVEELRYEWVTDVSDYISIISDEHNNSGGNNKLKRLFEYI